MAAAGNHQGQWSSGLYDCFDDWGNFCMTCCFPCITFGQNAEVIDRGNSSWAFGGLIFFSLSYLGFACLYSSTYRAKLRDRYRLPEDPCGDFWVHCFCIYCAICQESRELKSRGLDPSIGWVANSERIMNQGGVALAPPNDAGDMAR